MTELSPKQGRCEMKRVFQVVLVLLVTTILPVSYVKDVSYYPVLIWCSVLFGFVCAYIIWAIENG